MKTFANANHPSVTKTLQVHGGMAVTALTALIGITADHVKAEASFDIGDNTLALLFNTGSYERELVPFVQAHSSQFPHLNVEMIQINGTNYIAVTLKEEKKEEQTIKELNDSSFPVRTFMHIGYATNNDYAHAIKDSKNNLINHPLGIYQPLNHPSFLEGKNFWLINHYFVGPEVLQRFIDQIKDQVSFNLEVVKINSFYYIAMTKKEQPKEEVKKEEIFNGIRVNPKARLTLQELNNINFNTVRLQGGTGFDPSWIVLNFGGALQEERQAFIDHHNNLGGQYEFCLYMGCVNYRKRPEEAKEEPKAEPKTEVVVQPATVCRHQFISIDSIESGYIANERATLTDILAVTKETVEDTNNAYDPDDEVRIYQLIGTVKRIVKVEENVTAIKTNPLADAANHPAKTNDAYSEENQEQAYQQYNGGF